MKKFLRILAVAVCGVFMLAGAATAAPFTFGDGGSALQGVLDGITQAPVLGSSSVDVTTDALTDAQDSYWNITASGGSVATMIIELAEFAPGNTFGVYSGTNYVQLFAGADSAGAQVLLSIKDDWSVFVDKVDTGVDFVGGTFGFYLDSTAYTTGGLWHSDTLLNADGLDHMAAYQGTNTDTVKLP